MPYDEQIAQRVRALLADQPDVAEQAMFGGLAFLVGGHMAVAASGQGGLLVRADPDETDALLATTAAEPFVMRGRGMAGWLRVDGADLGGDEALADWVERGTVFARSLPPKPPR